MANSANGPSQLLTVPEVQNTLGVGRSTVYRLFDTSRLRSVRVGRTRRVLRADLEEFISSLIVDDALNNNG